MSLTQARCDQCHKALSWGVGEKIKDVTVKMHLGMLMQGDRVSICNDCGQYSNLLNASWHFCSENCFLKWAKNRAEANSKNDTEASPSDNDETEATKS